MKNSKAFLIFSALTLLCVGIVRSQTPPPNCGLAEIFVKLLRCLSMVFPDVRRPIYAPIIGGADKDYAKDMCKNREKFVEGVECLEQILSDCSRDKRIGTLVNAIMPPRTLEAGTRYFCDHLPEYLTYAECYFDFRDALMDCYRMNSIRIAKYFETKGITDTMEGWIRTLCSGFRNETNCQVKMMTQECGWAAGEHLRDITMKFYPERCGAICLSPPFLLIVALIWVTAMLQARR